MSTPPSSASPPTQPMSQTNSPVLPKDAIIISTIMQSLSISECEPQVIPVLLEYSYRHITDILIAASSFSEHCGRSPLTEMTLHDIRYAIQSLAARISSSSGGTSGVPGIRPSRELLLELSTKKNAEPLPINTSTHLEGTTGVIAGRSALRLPPDDLCLLGQQSHPTGIVPPPHHKGK